MIADHPLSTGGVNVMVACPFHRVATTFVGAFEVVAGIRELLADDAELVPTSLVAVTVNVYATPLVRPVMIIGEVLPVAVCPPLEVTVY